MENEIQFRGFRNIGPRKFETKVNSGAVLHRSALGDLKNKPLQQNLINQKPSLKANQILKKDITSISLRPLRKENEKENIPTLLPQRSKIIEDVVDESMEVEEEEEVEELSVAFSSGMLSVKDIDEKDHDNPQLVSIYVKDIYKYMWDLEELNKVKPNYLDGRKITGRMRSVLIDWLVQVHVRFTLLQETLYLTVAIIDRYLQIDAGVTKDKLQLVGVTAMFIASKYEEMYIPEIGDFAYITDKAFSKKDIRGMEVKMLTGLGFYISYPLPLHFLRRDSKAWQVQGHHHNLAKYLMELTLPEYSFCSYKASLIAASSLYLSMKLVGDGSPWDSLMMVYSNYHEKDILPVVYKMSALVIRSATAKLQTVRSKYKSSKLMKISDITELKPTSRTLRNYAEKACSN